VPEDGGSLSCERGGFLGLGYSTVTKNRITVRLEGDARDGGDLRLTDFLRELEAIKSALKQTVRVLGYSEMTSVYYKIVDLTHSSPATVVLEAVQAETDPKRDRRLPGRVVASFFGSLGAIKKKGRIPLGFDYSAAEAYREIVAPLKKHVSSIILTNGRHKISIDQEYEKRIDNAIGPDSVTEGSIAGTLDTVRLHNKTAFEIFPTIGPTKIYCVFPPHLKERVKSGLEHYVRVSGKLRYKHWDKFPYAIDANEIEIYPPDEALPTLSELRGMAPDLTDGLGEDEFLEKIRHAWQA